jgi:predicted TIM-barrel fold metal-dependent hydrolase
MTSAKIEKAEMNRRAFIEKVAFAGAAAATAAAASGAVVRAAAVGEGKPTTVAQAQQADGSTRAVSTTKGLVIDCEHHLKQWGQCAITPQRSMDWMDANGIDMAFTTTHVRPTDPIEVVRESNDLLAKLVQDHPKRYIGCATVPIGEGGKPDLREVERIVKQLGLHSVYIATRPGDPGPLFLDSQEMFPFYEKCSELKIPIKVEITNWGPAGMEELLEPKYHLQYPLHMMFAREFDMASSVLRLMFGGILERFPDLTFLIDHYGGGVSMVMDRAEVYWNGYTKEGRVPFYDDKPLITKPFRTYFDKLYFGMAGRGPSIDTLKMILVNVSPKKIMFATDWPYIGIDDNMGKEFVANVRNMKLPQEDIDGILGGNAWRVFGPKR